MQFLSSGIARSVECQRAKSAKPGLAQYWITGTVKTSDIDEARER